MAAVGARAQMAAALALRDLRSTRVAAEARGSVRRSRSGCQAAAEDLVLVQSSLVRQRALTAAEAVLGRQVLAVRTRRDPVQREALVLGGRAHWVAQAHRDRWSAERPLRLKSGLQALGSAKRARRREVQGLEWGQVQWTGAAYVACGAGVPKTEKIGLQGSDEEACHVS